MRRDMPFRNYRDPFERPRARGWALWAPVSSQDHAFRQPTFPGDPSLSGSTQR